MNVRLEGLDLRVVPARAVLDSKGQGLRVGGHVMLSLPKQGVEPVDGRFHDGLHLFVRDVRVFGATAARRAKLAGMNVFDGAVAKGKSDKRFRLDGECGIASRFHRPPSVDSNYTFFVRTGDEAFRERRLVRCHSSGSTARALMRPVVAL